MRNTGLSLPAVCVVADEPIAEGEMIKTGPVRSGRGRPAVLLEVNHDTKFAVAVWLTEGSIEVGRAPPPVAPAVEGFSTRENVTNWASSSVAGERRERHRQDN